MLDSENGKAAAAFQNAAEYQKLGDRTAKSSCEETIAAIREGLADVESGRVKPARHELKSLARKYSIPTERQ